MDENQNYTQYTCKLCECVRDCLDFYEEGAETWCRICHMHIDAIMYNLNFFRATSGVEGVLNLMQEVRDRDLNCDSTPAMSE